MTIALDRTVKSMTRPAPLSNRSYSKSREVKLALASKSPVKEQGTFEALQDARLEARILCYDVQVGVSQPIGMAQLEEVCYTRLVQLKEISGKQNPDYWVAVESGKVNLSSLHGAMDVTIAMAISKKKGDFISIGHGGGFLIPNSVLVQLEEKGELGLCDVEGVPFDKKKGGMVDLISLGSLKRVEFVKMAVRAALVPLLTDVEYP